MKRLFMSALLATLLTAGCGDSPEKIAAKIEINKLTYTIDSLLLADSLRRIEVRAARDSFQLVCDSSNRYMDSVNTHLRNKLQGFRDRLNGRECPDSTTELLNSIEAKIEDNELIARQAKLECNLVTLRYSAQLSPSSRLDIHLLQALRTRLIEAADSM